jgi:hypothetical protein
VKKGGYKKFSIELDSVCDFALFAAELGLTAISQFQKLLNDSIADVDQVLAAMKKTTGAK